MHYCFSTPAESYEEGGWSFNARKHLEGTIQQIEKYEIDGADSLIYLRDTVWGFNSCSTPLSLYFWGTDPKITTGNIWAFCTENKDPSLRGWWYFSGRKSATGRGYLDLYIKGLNRDNPKWKIIKLTKKQLWIEKEDNGKKYELKMARI